MNKKLVDIFTKFEKLYALKLYYWGSWTRDDPEKPWRDHRKERK